MRTIRPITTNLGIMDCLVSAGGRVESESSWAKVGGQRG